MKCKKSMGKYDEGNNCSTCDIDGICVACSIACHHEHKFRWPRYCFYETAENKWKGTTAFKECQCFKSNCLFHEIESQSENQSNISNKQCVIT